MTQTTTLEQMRLESNVPDVYMIDYMSNMLILECDCEVLNSALYLGIKDLEVWVCVLQIYFQVCVLSVSFCAAMFCMPTI